LPRRLLHILFLFFLTPAQTFAQVDSTVYVQALADSIVVDNTIKGTVAIGYGVTFETIEREGNRYYAVTSDGIIINR